jgi:predicted phosphodiesterase
MRIIIIGDVHGRHRDLVEILRFAREKIHIGAAIQVGDFGFFAEEMARLSAEKIRSSAAARH